MAQAQQGKKYWAFISYSSKDKRWGQWLHRRLENYPIPKEFQGTELFDGAVLGKNLRPVFRDRDELSGSSDLGPAIAKALAETRYLIVLCSKNSAKSEWVNKEIEDFRKMGGETNILALILDGEPNASSQPQADASNECFPPALRYPAEPLAGDLRKEGDGKERGFLKVLSGIAQLDFDVLYRRHERAQQKKRLMIGAAALVIMGLLSGLSLFAFAQKKEAERQEQEAVSQRLEAQKQRKEAVTQKIEAERQEKEAVAQRLEAEKQKKEAIRQGEIAEANREQAVEQRDLATQRLADSYFMTGTTKMASGEPLLGMRELVAALSIQPEHTFARQRLYDHLAGHNYALPVSKKLRLNVGEGPDAKLLGTGPNGQLLVWKEDVVLEITISKDGSLVPKQSLALTAKSVSSVLYHEASQQLVVWSRPNASDSIDTVSLYQREANTWTVGMTGKCGWFKHIQFDQSGRYLYLESGNDQYVWDTEEARVVFEHRYNSDPDVYGIESASCTFSPRSTVAVLSVDKQFELLELATGNRHPLPFEIDTKAFYRPSVYFSESQALLLVNQFQQGIRAVGVQTDADGALSGEFEDWGLLDEPKEASPFGTKVVSGLPTWQALPDDCLVYSRLSGEHVILDTKLLTRGEGLAPAMVKSSELGGLREPDPFHALTTAVSTDHRFLVDVDNPVRVYDLHQLQYVTEPFTLSPEAEDICWLGGEGAFAILDDYNDLQIWASEGTSLPALQGQAVGALGLVSEFSFKHQAFLDPAIEQTGICKLSHFGGARQGEATILTYGDKEKALDALFFNSGESLIVSFEDSAKFFNNSATVVYDLNDIEAEPVLLTDEHVNQLLHLESAKLLALHLRGDDRALLVDTQTLETIGEIPDSSYGTFGQWMAVSGDRKVVAWLIDSRTVGHAHMTGTGLGEVERIIFPEEIYSLNMSQSGAWTGVVLESGRVSLWRADAGSTSEMYRYEVGAIGSAGFVIDEEEACFHVSTKNTDYGTGAVATHDLLSGQLISLLSLPFEPTELRHGLESGKLYATTFSGHRRYGYNNRQPLYGAIWRWQCPPVVLSKDLIAMASAITGWAWNEESLLMKQAQRFSGALQQLLIQRHQSKERGTLRLTSLHENTSELYSIHEMSDRGTLNLLEHVPAGYQFLPLSRAIDGVKNLNNQQSARHETAELASKYLPAPDQVRSSGAALTYARLQLQLKDKPAAKRYLDASEKLGWSDALKEQAERLKAELD